MESLRPPIASGFCLILAILITCGLQAPAMGQAFARGDCLTDSFRTNDSFTPLPQGTLFCPLIADPKQPHSFATMLRGTSDSFPATNIGAVGIGDRFGIIRWGPAQLSLAGAVFSQFDLDTPSFDMINADYVVGLPVTFRTSGFSARARLYHQSSHLGDEFLLRSESERENLSFESLELMLSQELWVFRVYAGGEYLIRRSPTDLEPVVGHAGIELRPGHALVRVDPIGQVRFIAASDLKSTEEQEWKPGWSVRGGLEGSRARRADTPISRWQLLVEYYLGPTPYGQFYRGDIGYWGIGLHFTL